MSSQTLLQIINTNYLDTYLIDNDGVTFFKNKHKRHIAFAYEDMDYLINNSAKFSNNYELSIPKSSDYLTNICLKIKLPLIYAKYKYSIEESISKLLSDNSTYIFNNSLYNDNTNRFYLLNEYYNNKQSKNFLIKLDSSTYKMLNYYPYYYTILDADKSLNINTFDYFGPIPLTTTEYDKNIVSQTTSQYLNLTYPLDNYKYLFQIDLLNTNILLENFKYNTTGTNEYSINNTYFNKNNYTIYEITVNVNVNNWVNTNSTPWIYDFLQYSTNKIGINGRLLYLYTLNTSVYVQIGKLLVISSNMVDNTAILTIILLSGNQTDINTNNYVSSIDNTTQNFVIIFTKLNIGKIIKILKIDNTNVDKQIIYDLATTNDPYNYLIKYLIYNSKNLNNQLIYNSKLFKNTIYDHMLNFFIDKKYTLTFGTFDDRKTVENTLLNSSRKFYFKYKNVTTTYNILILYNTDNTPTIQNIISIPSSDSIYNTSFCYGIILLDTISIKSLESTFLTEDRYASFITFDFIFLGGNENILKQNNTFKTYYFNNNIIDRELHSVIKLTPNKINQIIYTRSTANEVDSLNTLQFKIIEYVNFLKDMGGFFTDNGGNTQLLTIEQKYNNEILSYNLYNKANIPFTFKLDLYTSNNFSIKYNQSLLSLFNLSLVNSDDDFSTRLNCTLIQLKNNEYNNTTIRITTTSANINSSMYLVNNSSLTNNISIFYKINKISFINQTNDNLYIYDLYFFSNIPLISKINILSGSFDLIDIGTIKYIKFSNINSQFDGLFDNILKDLNGEININNKTTFDFKYIQINNIIYTIDNIDILNSDIQQTYDYNFDNIISFDYDSTNFKNNVITQFNNTLLTNPNIIKNIFNFLYNDYIYSLIGATITGSTASAIETYNTLNLSTTINKFINGFEGYNIPFVNSIKSLFTDYKNYYKNNFNNILTENYTPIESQYLNLLKIVSFYKDVSPYKNIVLTFGENLIANVNIIVNNFIYVRGKNNNTYPILVKLKIDSVLFSFPTTITCSLISSLNSIFHLNLIDGYNNYINYYFDHSNTLITSTRPTSVTHIANNFTNIYNNYISTLVLTTGNYLSNYLYLDTIYKTYNYLSTTDQLTKIKQNYIYLLSEDGVFSYTIDNTLTYGYTDTTFTFTFVGTPTGIAPYLVADQVFYIRETQNDLQFYTNQFNSIVDIYQFNNLTLTYVSDSTSFGNLTLNLELSTLNGKNETNKLFPVKKYLLATALIYEQISNIENNYDILTNTYKYNIIINKNLSTILAWAPYLVTSGNLTIRENNTISYPSEVIIIINSITYSYYRTIINVSYISGNINRLLNPRIYIGQNYKIDTFQNLSYNNVFGNSYGTSGTGIPFNNLYINEKISNELFKSTHLTQMRHSDDENDFTRTLLYINDKESYQFDIINGNSTQYNKLGTIKLIIIINNSNITIECFDTINTNVSDILYIYKKSLACSYIYAYLIVNSIINSTTINVTYNYLNSKNLQFNDLVNNNLGLFTTQYTLRGKKILSINYSHYNTLELDVLQDETTLGTITVWNTFATIDSILYIKFLSNDVHFYDSYQLATVKVRAVIGHNIDSTRKYIVEVIDDNNILQKPIFRNNGVILGGTTVSHSDTEVEVIITTNVNILDRIGSVRYPIYKMISGTKVEIPASINTNATIIIILKDLSVTWAVELVPGNTLTFVNSRLDTNPDYTTPIIISFLISSVLFGVYLTSITGSIVSSSNIDLNYVNKSFLNIQALTPNNINYLSAVGGLNNTRLYDETNTININSNGNIFDIISSNQIKITLIPDDYLISTDGFTNNDVKKSKRFVIRDYNNIIIAKLIITKDIDVDKDSIFYTTIEDVETLYQIDQQLKYLLIPDDNFSTQLETYTYTDVNTIVLTTAINLSSYSYYLLINSIIYITNNYNEKLLKLIVQSVSFGIPTTITAFIYNDLQSINTHLLQQKDMQLQQFTDLYEHTYNYLNREMTYFNTNFTAIYGIVVNPVKLYLIDFYNYNFLKNNDGLIKQFLIITNNANLQNIKLMLETSTADNITILPINIQNNNLGYFYNFLYNYILENVDTNNILNIQLSNVKLYNNLIQAIFNLIKSNIGTTTNQQFESIITDNDVTIANNNILSTDNFIKYGFIVPNLSTITTNQTNYISNNTFLLNYYNNNNKILDIANLTIDNNYTNDTQEIIKSKLEMKIYVSLKYIRFVIDESQIYQWEKTQIPSSPVLINYTTLVANNFFIDILKFSFKYKYVPGIPNIITIEQPYVLLSNISNTKVGTTITMDMQLVNPNDLTLLKSIYDGYLTIKSIIFGQTIFNEKVYDMVYTCSLIFDHGIYNMDDDQKIFFNLGFLSSFFNYPSTSVNQVQSYKPTLLPPNETIQTLVNDNINRFKKDYNDLVIYKLISKILPINIKSIVYDTNVIKTFLDHIIIGTDYEKTVWLQSTGKQIISQFDTTFNTNYVFFKNAIITENIYNTILAIINYIDSLNVPETTLYNDILIFYKWLPLLIHTIFRSYYTYQTYYSNPQNPTVYIDNGLNGKFLNITLNNTQKLLSDIIRTINLSLYTVPIPSITQPYATNPNYITNPLSFVLFKNCLITQPEMVSLALSILPATLQYDDPPTNSQLSRIYTFDSGYRLYNNTIVTASEYTSLLINILPSTLEYRNNILYRKTDLPVGYLYNKGTLTLTNYNLLDNNYISSVNEFYNITSCLNNYNSQYPDRVLLEDGTSISYTEYAFSGMPLFKNENYNVAYNILLLNLNKFDYKDILTIFNEKQQAVIDVLTTYGTNYFSQFSNLTIQEYYNKLLDIVALLKFRYSNLDPKYVSVTDFTTQQFDITEITKSTDYLNNIITYNNNYNTKYNNYISLQTQINTINARTGTIANFAWINKLGHFMIKIIELNINDQNLNTITGDCLNFNYELTTPIEKQNGYNIMIGNVPELYQLTKIIKPEYYLFIKLPTFLKNNPLPLLALLHSNIKLKISFNDLNNCYKSDDYVDLYTNTGINNVLFELRVLLGLVNVTNEEREEIARNNYTLLFEQYDYKNQVISTTNANINIPIYKSCKHLQFAGRLINNSKNYYNYSVGNYQSTSIENGLIPVPHNFTYNEYGFLNKNILIIPKSPILTATLKLNNIDRFNIYESDYLEFVQQIENNLNSKTNRILSFNFDLDKNKNSGSCNFGLFDNIRLVLTLDNTINENNMVEIIVIAKTYNILQIKSGLSNIVYNNNVKKI